MWRRTLGFVTVMLVAGGCPQKGQVVVGDGGATPDAAAAAAPVPDAARVPDAAAAPASDAAPAPDAAAPSASDAAPDSGAGAGAGAGGGGGEIVIDEPRAIGDVDVQPIIDALEGVKAQLESCRPRG